jgi:hypothetical protein
VNLALARLACALRVCALSRHSCAVGALPAVDHCPRCYRDEMCGHGCADLGGADDCAHTASAS